MNQIMSWICLLSICFLSLQVMIFLCEDTVKQFNNIIYKKRNRTKNTVIATGSYNYKSKIAK